MENTAILGRILICYNHFNRNKYERKQKYGEKETGLWTGGASSDRMQIHGLMGCGNKATAEGRTEIEIVSYKKEAVDTFNKIAARFNETHDDIHLTIDSPNEAMTILKTRFIREDYPDIIVIGGDMDYSNFLDAGLFADISDLDVLSETKSAHLDMDKQLEFIPQDGTYGLPYAANAAGILYNKDMFEQHGWETPETWNEFAPSLRCLLYTSF